MNKFNILLSSILLGSILSACGGDLGGSPSPGNDTPVPDELIGKWNYHGPVLVDNNNINQIWKIKIDNNNQITFETICFLNNRTLVNVSDSSPVSWKEGILTVRKDINKKIFYRIKNNAFEFPPSSEIDDKTLNKNILTCSLELGKGDWQYKISTPLEGKVLEISQQHGPKSDDIEQPVTFFTFIKKKF